MVDSLFEAYDKDEYKWIGYISIITLSSWAIWAQATNFWRVGRIYFNLCKKLIFRHILMEKRLSEMVDSLFEAYYKDEYK